MIQHIERKEADKQAREVLAKRIYELRNENGYSLIQLAEILDVDRNTIAAWERLKDERREPPLSKLRQMCELFKCDVGYLLGEYDCKTKEATDIQEEIGLNENATNNLRTLQRLIQEKGKLYNNGRLDNQDVANFLLSYDGWAIIDTLCDYFNTPKEDTITASADIKTGEMPNWYTVNVRSLVLSKLQDVLSQMYDRVKRGGM